MVISYPGVSPSMNNGVSRYPRFLSVSVVTRIQGYAKRETTAGDERTHIGSPDVATSNQPRPKVKVSPRAGLHIACLNTPSCLGQECVTYSSWTLGDALGLHERDDSYED
jgi:hypothetical protein